MAKAAWQGSHSRGVFLHISRYTKRRQSAARTPKHQQTTLQAPYNPLPSPMAPHPHPSRMKRRRQFLGCTPAPPGVVQMSSWETSPSYSRRRILLRKGCPDTPAPGALVLLGTATGPAVFLGGLGASPESWILSYIGLGSPACMCLVQRGSLRSRSNMKPQLLQRDWERAR